MRVADFDYQLPPELIAQRPAEARDRSRLLVLDRQEGRLVDRLFLDLLSLLREGDLLVLNDAKVLPAKLRGTFAEGGNVEILLVRERQAGCWEALLKPSRKAWPGRGLVFVPGRLEAIVEAKLPEGRFLVRFTSDGDFRQLLDCYGAMPLPPYIKKRQAIGVRDKELDQERYQTVYAKKEGAIAAPTAGLHFTWALLDALKSRGVGVTCLTLLVGIGTFRPIRAEEVERHRMEPEEYVISEEAAKRINETKQSGGRVFAVGTTTVRALEEAAWRNGLVEAGWGFASLFIYPGYRFKIVDALITNFHLPRSTPLMLVSAFAGRELTLKAYCHAVLHRYRFYSYGDAMLIL